MIYEKKCSCCNAKFTLMYSGKDYLLEEESLKGAALSSVKNLMLSVEKGNPWMAISMEEVPNIIKHLQEAYKEYQKVQKELKEQGRLEILV